MYSYGFFSSSLLNDCLSSTDELSRIHVPQEPSRLQEPPRIQEPPRLQEPLEYNPSISSSDGKDKKEDVKVGGMRDEGMDDYVEDDDEDDDDQGCYEEEDYSVPVDLETNVYQVNLLNCSCTLY